jgi:hypothetical protein
VFHEIGGPFGRQYRSANIMRAAYQALNGTSREN